MEPLCVNDFEKYLHECLPKASAEYISGAADESSTHLNNQASWRRWRIRSRYLTGVARETVDTSVEFLGLKLKTPICLAPAALQCLAHEEGEVATARGCLQNGNCMMVSMVSTRSYEDIMDAAGTEGCMGAHVDLPKSRHVLDQLLSAIEGHGFKFIVITIDKQVHGYRRNETRNNFFAFVEGTTLPQWEKFFFNDGEMSVSKRDGIEEHTARSDAERHFESVKTGWSWDDVEYVMSHCKLPLVLKGILTAEDACEAVRRGVKGIIVSNHGGRQLDTVLSTLEALPGVVAAVDGRIPILVDGGIRLGTDVFKALALGATAVVIGRPIFWGLAYKGAEGVSKVLDILQQELERAMTLSGCKDIASITRSHVIHESALCGCSTNGCHNNK